jgi:5-(carboxyamino)imidazole ribonucleotide synthase
MTYTLTPEPTTLGVVGGGQLGRMLAEAASPLGVDVVVLDPTPDCPAVGPARDQIIADFDDAEGVRRLAERADYLTYEIELADADLLETVAEETGTPVHPDPGTLRVTQDKLVEKRTLADHGIPVPAFRRVDDADDLAAALDDLGRPVMLKAREGGYDGRGNVPVSSAEDAPLADLGPCVAEAMVDFEREVSVIGVRGDGETATFPVAENVHEAEILRETVVPARTSEGVRERAIETAYDVLDALDGRGVFGIELFEVSEARSASEQSSGERSDPRDDGEIRVNEIAPRPHNSGHYTIEGAHASQFEQHVRAVLGLPLGDTRLRDPAVTANVLGTVEEPGPVALQGVESVLAEPGLHLHWYGKREARLLRKMGHVTGIAGDGEDRSGLLARTRAARDSLTFKRPGTEDRP